MPTEAADGTKNSEKKNIYFGFITTFNNHKIRYESNDRAAAYNENLIPRLAAGFSAISLLHFVLQF